MRHMELWGLIIDLERHTGNGTRMHPLRNEKGRQEYYNDKA